MIYLTTKHNSVNKKYMVIDIANNRATPINNPFFFYHFTNSTGVHQEVYFLYMIDFYIFPDKFIFELKFFIS